MTRTLRYTAVIAGLFLSIALYAAESEYPSRPVRMIVPFAPGGASDFVGRIIQPAMAELMKQQVVVDNRAGAAGNIGVEVAAHATPDGYNFLLGNVGTMAINANIFTKFPVKPLRDLEGVTQVVDVPGCFVVHPSIPAKSVKEMVAYMKANPGKLNYGSPAPSSANRLEMEMFLMAATGTNAVQINYKGRRGARHGGTARQRSADDVRDLLVRRELRQAGPGAHAGCDRAATHPGLAGRADDARAGLRHGGRLVAGHLRAQGHAPPRRDEALQGRARGDEESGRRQAHE